jgi:hypothetical protein
LPSARRAGSAAATTRRTDRRIIPRCDTTMNRNVRVVGNASNCPQCSFMLPSFRACRRRRATTTALNARRSRVLRQSPRRSGLRRGLTHRDPSHQISVVWASGL